MTRQLTGTDLANLGLLGLARYESHEMADELREWGFQVLGVGGYGVVAALPDDPAHVLRLSSQDDGWVGYALALQGETHAPQVRAFGYHDWRWFAIVERLDPLPPELEKLVPILRAAVAEEEDCAAGNPHVLGLAERWPDLPEFVRDNLQGTCDIVASNLMMRGDTLVVNDPHGIMVDDVYDDLAGKWRVMGVPEIDLDEDGMEPG